MSAETDLVTAIEGDAPLMARATALTTWPLPTGATLPALTYYLVDTPTTQAVDKSIHERRSRFTVTVWAETPKDRAEVAELLVTALLAMSGWVEIIDAGRDVPEPVSGLYRREVDVGVLR